MFDSSDRTSVVPDGMIVTVKDIVDDSHHCRVYRSYICDDEIKDPTSEFFDIDNKRFASSTKTTTYASHFVPFKDHHQEQVRNELYWAEQAVKQQEIRDSGWEENEDEDEDENGAVGPV